MESTVVRDRVLLRWDCRDMRLGMAHAVRACVQSNSHDEDRGCAKTLGLQHRARWPTSSVRASLISSLTSSGMLRYYRDPHEDAGRRVVWAAEVGMTTRVGGSASLRAVDRRAAGVRQGRWPGIVGSASGVVSQPSAMIWT